MIKDVVLCGECKYKPYKKKYRVNMESNGFIVETWEDARIEESLPFSPCPCTYSDDIYSRWIPDDNWYCGNGEPK